MPNIIGLSSYYHDSACALLIDGAIAAAAQEERFSRKKHDASLPKAAFRYCLKEVGLTINDVDCIAYYEQPQLKLERQLSTELPEVDARKAHLLWRTSHRPEREIREILGYAGSIKYVGHHEAHAASAFYYSGFREAAIMTVDGVGEWATTTYGSGCGSNIKIFEEVHFPDSLGLLYSTVTSYLGFAVNDGEYKVMGLAPYGEPTYMSQLRTLIEPGEQGQYRLDLQYFDFTNSQRMFSDALPLLFGHPPRKPEGEIVQFHKDIAKSLQVVLEETLVKKSRYLHDRVGSDNLCMAGGVALNCVANSRILREGSFQHLFVQPAAGDAGTALGAAALVHVQITGDWTCRGPLAHVFFGPSFSSEEIYELLCSTPFSAQDFRGREEAQLEEIVERLLCGQVVAWFMGRMEFGPRALGGRSILADPRRPEMRTRINLLVKKREAFRPFAPAALEERADAHFDLGHASPFMLETCQVISELDLPAITHVDGSARLQTVNATTNPRFYRLLKKFESRSGCPILLNTSFNLRDEPIVCNPVEALLCFIRSDIDVLVMEDFLLDRSTLSENCENLVRASVSSPHREVSHKVYALT